MKLTRAGDLLDHADNWHLHPQFQNEALEGALEQHGIVDVLLAYHSEKRGGYVLVNGHGRKALDQDVEWPVIILDINDEEADDVLALLDTIGSWGQTDALKLHELISKAKAKNIKMATTVQRIKASIASQVEVAMRAREADESGQRPKKEKFAFDEQRAASVKVVLPVDDLMTVETAIKRTGLKRRGAALQEICQFFIENYKDGPRHV
jgi:hypothetical protein